MIPVLSAQQVRSADAHTISAEPIPSIDLMERAARGCVAWLCSHYPGEQGYLVICGCGNNGGDGLAVARMLHEAGVHVRACLIRHRDNLSPDAAINLSRCVEAGVPVLDPEVGSIPAQPAEHEVVIDALLGTGLERPLSGWLRTVVMAMNQWPNPVVAIDLPSGLFAEDNATNDPKAIIMADHVLTFEVPKLALLLPENGPFVGQWHRIPIGLDQGFVEGLPALAQVVEPGDVAALMPDRPRTGHKGTFGHALLIAGGRGKVGAAILAARACTRAGAGLITVQLPADLQAAMHAAVPEVMVDPRPLEGHTSKTRQRFSAIGIGPGIGMGEEAARQIKVLIQTAPAPLVLDADALNLLSENPTWLGFLPKASILTPHPGEFDRLAGKSATGFERLDKARAFALRFGVVLILKGANTAICAPDGMVYFNPTGNPGMARGGSGDALTGIITGLLAQGLTPLSAAVLGVYAHGLAGDLAAAELGMDGMVPTDLIEHLPLTWKRIRGGS